MNRCCRSGAPRTTHLALAGGGSTICRLREALKDQLNTCIRDSINPTRWTLSITRSLHALAYLIAAQFPLPLPAHPAFFSRSLNTPFNLKRILQSDPDPGGLRCFERPNQLDSSYLSSIASPPLPQALPDNLEPWNDGHSTLHLKGSPTREPTSSALPPPPSPPYLCRPTLNKRTFTLAFFRIQILKTP